MDVLKSIVYSAVEFSNLFCCLAILSCTGALFMFLMKAMIILTQREDHPQHHHRHHHHHGQSTTSLFNQNSSLQVPRLNMTRVHIPFTFRLIEIGNHSPDEIQIVVTSQVKYTIQAFWGVSIRDLHMFLWKPWIEIKEHAYSKDNAILSKNFYQEIATDVRNKEPHNDEQITLKSPKPPMVLGAPPRLAYPLVLFLIRDSETNITHPDDTVVLVNVIHLKDLVCPLPTSILAQYLKQASGQLSCLKQLYLATGDSISTDDQSSNGLSSSSTSGNNANNISTTNNSISSTTTTTTSSLSLAEPVACASGSSGPLLCSDGPQTEQLCIVCHYFPLSRALLPCRHTCICAICFSKLNRCPMCRSSITSYFCIRSEEYIPPGIFEQQQKSIKTKNVHWLDALNDRLTDFLGFR